MSDVMVRVPMDDVVLMCPVDQCMQCIPGLLVLDLPVVVHGRRIHKLGRCTPPMSRRS
jgi:hypothetical protein